jgi:ribosomal peptide maturation radical SAM protein 1
MRPRSRGPIRRNGRAAPPSVVLVSMPWTTLGEPSLGLSVLKSVLDGRGHACRVRHLNLFLLQFIRAPTYFAIANSFALNEFVFSGVFDEELAPLQRRWLRLKVEEMLTVGLIDETRFRGIDGVVEQVVRLRQEIVPRWLEECADEIAASPATLVGFTCMFDQTVASLALAKLIKERAPTKLVAMGGYALRAPTGEAVMNAFPWVDAICIGEGEHVIGPLAEASAGIVPLNEVGGILIRTNGQVCTTSPVPPFDMNRSPTPDFADFFSDLEELQRVHAVEIQVDTLPLETSRGCWWGAQRHCIFCGIADEDMYFRSRSAQTILADLDELYARHGISRFRFSDYILPRQYHETLLPLLARRQRKFALACEMKANTSLEKMRQLAAAGFTDVQPGIESFSTDVLRKMDKGVSAIGNVQTLLLGKRFGVHIHYNFLFGLPDDDADEYRQMARTLASLAHLDPPLAVIEVQITRFAPLQVSPERFGIQEAHYEPSYELVFSPRFLRTSGFDLAEYCYYFERPFENSSELTGLYGEIAELIAKWKRVRAEREVELWYEPVATGMRVFDSRFSTEGVTLEFGEHETLVYKQCTDKPISTRTLARALETELASDDIAEALATLDQHSLLFRDGAAMIGLAVPTAETRDHEPGRTRIPIAVSAAVDD